jgi:hypothetical protein
VNGLCLQLHAANVTGNAGIAYLVVTESTPLPTLKEFFFHSLLWNLLFMPAFAIILLVCFEQYTGLKATRGTFLWNIASLPIAATHSVLLVLFMIHRFRNKHYHYGLWFLFNAVINVLVTSGLFFVLSAFGCTFLLSK